MKVSTPDPADRGAPRDPVVEPDLRGFAPSVHNRIAALLRCVEERLSIDGPRGPTYSRDALRRRLVQEIAWLVDTPLRREDAQRACAGKVSLMVERRVFWCGGLQVDSAGGFVRPGLRLYLASLTRFVGIWLTVLGLMVEAFLRGRDGFGTTLVFGVPEESMTREGGVAFAEFARNGPVRPFAAAEKLVIESTADGRSAADTRIFLARRPLFHALRRAATSLGELLRFLGAHLATAARFLVACVRHPLIAILWRDYGQHSAVESLDRRRRLDGIILTNSNWSRQLLCYSDLPGKRYRVHFVFYSQNDQPTSYVDIADRCLEFPTMRLIRSDECWVWTPGRAELLSRIGVGKRNHVVGPIIWETVPRTTSRDSREWIGVFDVTPFVEEANRERGYLGHYYAAENLLAFLDGIERAAKRTGIGLPLVLKHKRNPPAFADTTYLRRCRDLRILPPDTSAAFVIRKSAFVIVYPFSTVAYVADALGVPAIYFDPTGKVEPTFEPAPHIRFASGPADLVDRIREIVAA